MSDMFIRSPTHTYTYWEIVPFPECATAVIQSSDYFRILENKLLLFIFKIGLPVSFHFRFSSVLRRLSHV